MLFWVSDRIMARHWPGPGHDPVDIDTATEAAGTDTARPCVAAIWTRSGRTRPGTSPP